MSNICEVSHISFGYSPDKNILSDVSFEIKGGEIVGILGKNGCGKSTLLNIIAGFLSEYSGSLIVKGKDIKCYSNKERACTMSYIQQNKITVPNYYCVEDFIIEGRRPFRPFGFYTKEDYDLIDKVLDECNLQDYRKRFLKELSGGEVQRCIFARAIMKQSDFFLFDEPCSAMDIKYQKEFFSIANDVRQNLNAAILITIHDINLAVNYCDRLIILNHGNIIYDGNALSVASDVISEAFDTIVSSKCNNKKYFYY